MNALSVGRPFAGISGGQNTRGTAQGIDFEPGIIRQREQTSLRCITDCFQRCIFNETLPGLGNPFDIGKVFKVVEFERQITKQLSKLLKFPLVLCGQQEALRDVHLAASGARVTRRDPTRPNEDREVHSSPSSFRITTLTAYGKDREASSIAGALLENTDRSCSEKISTKEIAAC